MSLNVRYSPFLIDLGLKEIQCLMMLSISRYLQSKII